LAATHRDLSQEVAAGRFREDLFYRLDVLQVHIPPLRDHPEDIPEIATTLLARRHRRQNDPPPPSLSQQALDRLSQLPLRGNVRELENILERALSLTEGPVIPPEAIQGGREEAEERPESDGEAVAPAKSPGE
ncbi:MAG: sigma 54-interacting transcriptional regulator, partial [Thiohalorhabdaceae bacterium]